MKDYGDFYWTLKKLLHRKPAYASINDNDYHYYLHIDVYILLQQINDTSA